MPYTVILPSGNRMHFYIEQVAKTYALMYKGTLVTDIPIKLKLVA